MILTPIRKWLVLIRPPLAGFEVPGDTSPPTTRHSFVEQYDLDLPDCKGTATIEVATNVVKVREPCKIDIIFTNLSTGTDFYNPFFCQLTHLPGELAIYDSNHNYRGNLWTLWTYISWIGPQPGDWVFVPTGGHIDCRGDFVISEWFTPGEYFIQLIYYRAFIAFKPVTPPESERDYPFDKSDFVELFRSNVVKIRLVNK